jgi:predicted RNA binding protein YcfA (HicA-like mRNA interferase family)
MLLAFQKFFLVARCSAGHVDISVYDVYCAIMTSKELIALMNQDGWTLRGSKGSLHVFVHPSKAGHLTVPHPKKDLGTGLVQKILKQAGLK